MPPGPQAEVQAREPLADLGPVATNALQQPRAVIDGKLVRASSFRTTLSSNHTPSSTTASQPVAKSKRSPGRSTTPENPPSSTPERCLEVDKGDEAKQYLDNLARDRMDTADAGWKMAVPSNTTFTPVKRKSYYAGSQANSSLSPQLSESSRESSELPSQSTPKPTEPTMREEPIKPKFQLQRMLEGQSLEVLENSVRAGTKILASLKKLFTERAVNAAADITPWIEQIERVQKQAVRSKTIVGVVGNTGAGKSSVINALLDEERLVPTNCMRACTAVITEISYNHERIPYRAEIHFIEPEDWRRELSILFQELFDGNGSISRDAANEDTEAGVAYAKIKAVYPKMTKEMIEKSSVEQLMQDPNVAVLGTKRTIQENNSLVFYKKFQLIIDSKEKVDGSKEKEKEKRPKEPAYWPLIKVVRLYVKHPALETGAVIVDLPGVHDSNAARAKVADGYMKQCTGLWIVAPINRAVDDKAAKNLLGETFKRQLKMDGGFNTVTFICSKTDDISITEAQDSLGLEEEFEIYEAERRKHEKEIKSLKSDLKDFRAAREELDQLMDRNVDDTEIWDTLKFDCEDGKTVFAPQSTKSAKRKAKGRISSSRKKRRRTSDSGDESDGSSYADNSDREEESEEEADVSEHEEARGSLTVDDINAKLAELKASTKDAKNQKAELLEHIKPTTVQISELEKKIELIDIKEKAKCIAGRNAYSRGAIQTDFAAGIKEIDEEIAEEEDAANFNPDADKRDYDEVAKDLPVFCVSSRGYQKLQGRFKKESKIHGFETIEETEIPQLQAHCKSLTIKGRTAACTQFLAVLSQILNSLLLWGTNDGCGANLTKDQKARQDQQLQKSLKQLESTLDKQVSRTCEELSDDFHEQIFDRFNPAIRAATEEADKAVLQWNSPVVRNDPQNSGIHWATYKAICRRNGTFRHHEWNVKLAEPIIRGIAPGWERCFNRRVQSLAQTFAKDAAAVFRKFHDSVSGRAAAGGSGASALYLLGEQQNVYAALLKNISDQALEYIIGTQKEINREFEPVILNAMIPAYELCVNECGTGSYKRMKAHMVEHVTEARHSMFQDSVDKVKSSLTTMVAQVKTSTLKAVDDVYTSARRDYLSAVAGGYHKYGEVMPKAQRMMRMEVVDVVEESEGLFEKVINGEPFDEEEPQIEGNSEEAAVALPVDDEEKKEDGGEVKGEMEEGESAKAENDEDSVHVEQSKTPSVVKDEEIKDGNVLAGAATPVMGEPMDDD